MDDSKKSGRDYDEFFKKQNDNESDQENKTKSDNQDRTSYYYSYGPFKSYSDDHRESDQASSRQQNEYSAVEVAQVHSVKASEPQQNKQTGNWAYPKKKSFFRSGFASFLAGIVIMGSFMIASDQMNLFTNNDTAAGSQSAGGNIYTNQGSANSDVRNASVDIVRPNTIADIAKNSSPAVVKIETVITQSSNNNPFRDDFFQRFFGEDMQTPQERPGGMGSGFIFEKNGYILTNEHVVSGADEIYVTVQGFKDPFKAKLLGSDFDLDLAVLKIEGDKSFKTLPIGNSSDLQVGDWLTAIGNPVGFDHTVSVGVLSATEREINIPDQQGTRRYKHLLQTDASINPGNSGGPLLNLNGEVIGINTAVSAQAQGIGFAIPTSTIIEVLDELKNNQTIPKPFIGVYLADIDETWKENLRLEDTAGALVTQIETGSPASRAGLQPGDVIVELNGSAVDSSEMLSDKIKEMKIGEKANLKVIRDGKTVETILIIADRNNQ